MGEASGETEKERLGRERLERVRKRDEDDKKRGRAKLKPESKEEEELKETVAERDRAHKMFLELDKRFAGGEESSAGGACTGQARTNKQQEDALHFFKRQLLVRF